MTDKEFKWLEHEVDETLKNLTNNSTIKFALTWYAHTVFHESLDFVEAQIKRIVERKGLKLVYMRTPDASGKMINLDAWMEG
ncbi:MAG: hypothetical protein J5521_03690 [Lachnospiraceae bacterium]|nr:hypothetical protein [Lachnospiraceae bacterium]